MENSKTARLFLALNAAFSLVVGLVLLGMPHSVAGLLFSDPVSWGPLVLRLLGGSLILFGLDLMWMASNRFVPKGQVLFITAMDIGWILATEGLLMWQGALFSKLGHTLLIIVALCVAVFAIGQFMGARRIKKPLSQTSVTSSGNKLVATVRRPVKAPKEVVWRVMNDHPGYADVADNLSKVEVVEGESMGMQRRCFGLKGESWLETCDLYEDGRVFGFRIHTEAKDYPYPIKDLHGEWSVKDDGVDATFTINIEAAPKGNALMRTLFKVAAKRQFNAVLADLADAWAARMEREARA